MIQNKTVTVRVPSNFTILQKLKADNSNRNYRKMFRKTPNEEYHYDIPHTLPLPAEPVPVSYFCLDK